MQKVSNEYKASMKSSLRERSYMMISFGLVNQEAQANATVMGNNFAYYSKQTGLFGQRKEDTVYATLEHDFTKVDGSMYFLPRENTSGNYYDTGLISKPLIPKSGYELLIELNVVATDIKGLTTISGLRGVTAPYTHERTPQGCMNLITYLAEMMLRQT